MIREKLLVRTWDHADSPLLWIEMIFWADIKKMKQYFGFSYGGHYFISFNQHTTFWKNTKSEARARQFGRRKYNDPQFVQWYCRKSHALEKKLAACVKELHLIRPSNISNSVLVKYFKNFFDHYSDLMAFYRFSRPEFYEKALADQAVKLVLLREVGKRRLAMHHAWMDAFKEAEPLFLAIGKKINMSSLEVKNFTAQEVLIALHQNVTPYNIKSRLHSFEFLYKNHSYIINTNLPKWKEMFRMRATVQGQPAYNGKVRGIVHVVQESLKGVSITPKAFPKNAVLVTAMTSPDMLPIMKRARAFITDEGGMLCHAAIVARELKKPCIIGTKIATKVFRDGQKVEVDATKGIVRLLKE